MKVLFVALMVLVSGTAMACDCGCDCEDCNECHCPECPACPVPTPKPV